MSVSVSVDLNGAQEFANAVARFDLGMQRQIQQQLFDWAQGVRAQAESLAPMRTGYLRGSIMVKSQDWQMEIGSEAVYAAAVEFGTRNQRAEPFLEPALEAYMPSLERVMLEALDYAKEEAQL
jgi:HK97 gp10 family phage protein